MININPRTKFLSSMRSNNLSNNEAVADLLDNAVDSDVNATKVRIVKDKERDLFVMSDNGCGMARDYLIDAMKLGSEGRDVPATTDLGLFGIGLKNSVLSLGRSLKLITKSEDDEYLTAFFDLDYILQRDKFEIPIELSTDEEIEEFKSYRAGFDNETGTVLIVTKLDRITITRDGDFVNSVVKHIGEVFRVFINDGLEVYVNEKLVKPRAPLGVDYNSHDKGELEDATLKYVTPEGIPFEIRVKTMYLPPVLEGVKCDYPHDSKNQGFYVMRNFRQIVHGTWLGSRVTHPSLNRIRGEIYFTGDMDAAFGVSTEKNQVKPQEWLLDHLQKDVFLKINALATRSKKEALSESLSTEHDKEDIKQIIESIDKRANRISPLKHKKENNVLAITHFTEPLVKPTPALPRKREQPYPGGTKKQKRALVNIQVGKVLEPSYICTFEPLLDGRLEIVINQDHAFYSEFWINQNLSTKDAFTKLLFAYGKSIVELSSETTDYQSMMDDFQRKVGDLFRKLID